MYASLCIRLIAAYLTLRQIICIDVGGQDCDCEFLCPPRHAPMKYAAPATRYYFVWVAGVHFDDSQYWFSEDKGFCSATPVNI